ncbi:4-(cytidine 5'-diphospho)-2-C-methyl-D-erythritol kinase [Bifidobacterium cuniculi]|uniref:4-diphosphocytidyl-2-C-methyl-D-erythritol kinase n=1 Tax=Bifidobacterium cuniculi TaxID=1688 RepID=A0A087ANA8_9BIFI|nr:4-diphosphocytidyl-2C-methyl-D-erythritol kinase [Bifidobacterium cuniculi]KFI60258.1 GHMP kinase C-terminal domain protein [Bifidobacterium cuniculi]
MSGRSVAVDGPAKTNLTLRVGAPRPEWGDRHELDTVYCALGLYDTVTVTEREPGSGYRLDLAGTHLGDLASSNADLRDNHAIRALLAMAQATDRAPDVAVRIDKRIPVAAGLGGGSVDAGATILALDALWELDWPRERLCEVAATLGADMPFCVMGGYAHGTGYGEQVTMLSAQDPTVAALAADGYAGVAMIGAYQAQLGTPEVYATFDVVGGDDRSRNDLQPAAVSLHPRSGQAIDAALQAGATQAFVSGSGPSVVAFAPDEDGARRIADAWTRTGAVDRMFQAGVGATPILRRPAA